LFLIIQELYHLTTFALFSRYIYLQFSIFESIVFMFLSLFVGLTLMQTDLWST
jgi:hypothetical protein